MKEMTHIEVERMPQIKIMQIWTFAILKLKKIEIIAFFKSALNSFLARMKAQ